MANLDYLQQVFEHCGAECTLENGQLDVRFEVKGFPLVFTTSVRKGHLFNHFSSLLEKFKYHETMNEYEKNAISRFINDAIPASERFDASNLVELAQGCRKDKRKIEKRWIKFECDFKSYYVSNLKDDE